MAIIVVLIIFVKSIVILFSYFAAYRKKYTIEYFVMYNIMFNIYYMYDNDKIAKKRQRFYFHFLTMKPK